ncbi:MAG: ABC transporter ATP-binding protein [Patescibacteria group bacterium]
MSKRFGNIVAVNDLSMDVDQGDVFAFLGSNGSGKTTTFRCLLDIYKPDFGSALIKGKRYTSKMSAEVGYLPEERGIYTKSSVRDVLYYFAALHGIKDTEAKKKVDIYLERVGLEENVDQKINQLSSGMQQKVQIGVAIIHEPAILILDEPFKGLDPLNRQLFLDIFEEQRQKGATILYSTHVVDEVQKIASRLIMIKNGKRVLYGSIDDIRNSFGTNTVSLSFSGDLPDRPELYKTRKEHNYAELTPAQGVKPKEILNFLVNETNLMIREFKIDRPSLNTIFINEAKQNKKENVE